MSAAPAAPPPRDDVQAACDYLRFGKRLPEWLKDKDDPLESVAQLLESQQHEIVVLKERLAPAALSSRDETVDYHIRLLRMGGWGASADVLQRLKERLADMLNIYDGRVYAQIDHPDVVKRARAALSIAPDADKQTSKREI